VQIIAPVSYKQKKLLKKYTKVVNLRKAKHLFSENK